MSAFHELTNKNFDLYAAKNYNNPSCLDIQEFYDDVARFKYLKRLFKKYINKGILQERLILNHIIIIHNVFYVKAAARMCFNRIDAVYWPALKTFLLYLNFITDDDYCNIPIDLHIVKQLQQV